MLRPYDLLENVLIDIEKGVRENVNIQSLSEKYEISQRHLQRVFAFAFKQALGDYIRSRKLAASLDDLLNSNSKLLAIALDYGFGYEQTYIRAFKREFGITPGDLRKTGQIVKVKPPLYLFDENRMPDGLLFGPDIVMVPQFHVIGKPYRIAFSDYSTVVPKITIQFMENDRSKIKNMVNSSVYYGLTRNVNLEEQYSDHLTSAQVSDLKNIPEGFRSDTFDASLCARFWYMGNHHWHGINNDILSGMFDKVYDFILNERVKYTLLFYEVQFTKIDTSFCDETYCQLEWFAPVAEKDKMSQKVHRFLVEHRKMS